MRLLWIVWLLLILPAGADLAGELCRACRRDPVFYRACLENLGNHYTPGYQAYELLDATGPLRLRTEPGILFSSDGELDLALQGPGYFQLSDNLLVRSAPFCARRGRLCTLDGRALMGPLGLPERAVGLEVDPQGELSGARWDGDGKPEVWGRLRIVTVDHPEWLAHSQGYLKTTVRSGPVRPALSTRVLSHKLELSNCPALEQQKTAQALMRLADSSGGAARHDLLKVLREHSRLLRASLDNLRGVDVPGFRANDVLVRRGSRFRLRSNRGQLHETKDPYNLAIDGNGFFVLQGGLLTRDGSFEMNREGLLAGHDGRCLLANGAEPLRIPADMSDIEVKGDGKVCGTRLNGDGKPEYIASIALAMVPEPGWLERVGTHLRVTRESGEYQLKTPGANGAGVLAQGYLEASNLGVVEQVKTLQALRNYAKLLGLPLDDDLQP
ncbi:MAG: hypothetical protein KF760_15150 [Candidatus Eremiobacteraeota bacterium]|nr:hypothetical protein [Candidatus Eremiobacteraeota bacterium]MCW5866375.1 hypothetical protein [Candidatus Eremiobacteraeota bacterium]